MQSCSDPAGTPGQLRDGPQSLVPQAIWLESGTSIHKIARSFNFNFRPRKYRHARLSWQLFPAFMLSLPRGSNPQGEPVGRATESGYLCPMNHPSTGRRPWPANF
ncbi:hypothetical protein D9X30_0791 [Cupriavidus sp. U2]|nr:hypothetical protein D9X30_0791 [Cupriavidus sp. U2]